MKVPQLRSGAAAALGVELHGPPQLEGVELRFGSCSSELELRFLQLGAARAAPMQLAATITARAQWAQSDSAHVLARNRKTATIRQLNIEQKMSVLSSSFKKWIVLQQKQLAAYYSMAL